MLKPSLNGTCVKAYWQTQRSQNNCCYHYWLFCWELLLQHLPLGLGLRTTRGLQSSMAMTETDLPSER